MSHIQIWRLPAGAEGGQYLLDVDSDVHSVAVRIDAKLLRGVLEILYSGNADTIAARLQTLHDMNAGHISEYLPGRRLAKLTRLYGRGQLKATG
jgi:hypothetical protein